jgi:hypothetical protein
MILYDLGDGYKGKPLGIVTKPKNLHGHPIFFCLSEMMPFLLKGGHFQSKL